MRSAPEQFVPPVKVLFVVFLVAMVMNSSPVTVAATDDALTGLWVGLATYTGFPGFRNPVSALLVESGGNIHGFLFMGVVESDGVALPATRLLDVRVRGKRVTARVEGDQDPFDRFRPGSMDEARATIKFNRKKGTARGSWTEIGFIQRRGKLSMIKHQAGNLDGIWGGQTISGGAEFNVGFHIDESPLASSTILAPQSDLSGFNGRLRTGLGMRQATGGKMAAGSRDGKDVTLDGPAGSFEGSIAKKGTQLRGTYTAPGGAESKVTLVFQGLAKASLPKLKRLVPATISPGETREFTIQGARFRGASVPTVSDPKVTIVDFELDGNDLKVTLLASSSLESGETVEINVLDRAGRAAKRPLSLNVQ